MMPRDMEIGEPSVHNGISRIRCVLQASMTTHTRAGAGAAQRFKAHPAIWAIGKGEENVLAGLTQLPYLRI